MTTVEDFFLDYEGSQRAIMVYMHQVMQGFPGVTSKIRYKIPFYYQHSWLCYMNPLKDDQSIEFCFTRANELSNEQGLLDFKDRKQIAGITLSNLREIPEDSLLEVIQEALLLDETVKYASKRKS